jgi:hypothetical protein
MITLTKLRRKPRHFQKFTGLTLSEFDQVLAQVTLAYEQAEHQRRHHAQRERQVGAGRPFALTLPERLLMGLIYLRLYCSQSLLSYLFDLDESNICREFKQRLMPVLLEVLPVPLRDAPLRGLADCAQDNTEKPKSSKKPRRINTLKELLEAHPDFEELLIDATEQEVPQPTDKLKRKQAYSGKQHDHTIKTQIVATKTLIIHVFGGLPGSLHDMTVLRASGVLHQIPKGVKVRQDKGYEGAENAYPDVDVLTPIKKKRHQKVTALGKAYNHLLSVLRMPVEHHFARLQKFGCLSGLWRGPQRQHEDVFCIVSGLLNFRATGRFELV